MPGYKKIPARFFKSNKKKYGLAEIYGASTKMPEMTLIAGDGKQIGPWVKCKDFIQDVFWSQKMKTSYAIYGYDYNPTIDPPPPVDSLLIGMRWKNKNKEEFSAAMENVKKTVENLESRIPWSGKKGLPDEIKTKFSTVRYGVAVVWGSRVWRESVARVSFFTWLIRASLNNEGNKIETIGNTPPNKKDVYYNKSGQKFIKALLKTGLTISKPDFKKYASVSQVHNNGFVRWSSANV